MVSQKEEEKKRRERERKKQRYAEDPDYREKILARNDASRIKHKDARNARRRQRYATDPEFRASVSLNVPSPTASSISKSTECPLRTTPRSSLDKAASVSSA
jgi:hypothetical protein